MPPNSGMAIEQAEDHRGHGERQQDEVLDGELEGRERDERADDERQHHAEQRAEQEVPTVGLRRVRHRVAADGAERGVRHRDLAGVAEQQVQREREGGVEQDLVEVVDPERHRQAPRRPSARREPGVRELRSEALTDRQVGEVADEHDEDGRLGVLHRQPDRGVLLDQRHDDAHQEDPDRRAGRAAEEGDDEGVGDRRRAHGRVDRVLEGVPDGGDPGADRAEEEARSRTTRSASMPIVRARSGLTRVALIRRPSAV